MAIQVRNFTLSDIVGWMRSGSLVLSPEFQRRNVWPASQKSRLVDTVVRGLPMPAIFIRERKSDLDNLTKSREVVDGQQRLRTMLGFVDPKLIGDYKASDDAFTVRPSHNKDIAGLQFKDLPDDVRQAILDYQFTVFVFPSSTGDEEILDVFSRINSTGVKLTHQEIRNSLFQGEFKTVTYGLANKHLKNWSDWNVFGSVHIARMDEAELTGDIINMMIKGLRPRTKKILDDLYKSYDLDFFEGNEICRRFDLVMDCIGKQFGSFLPTLKARGRTLFYVLFAIVYDMMFGLKSSLVETPKASCISIEQAVSIQRALTNIITGAAPTTLLEQARGATTDLPTRQALFDYLKKEVS